MKRTNGVRAASGAFLIPALQTGFGCTVVFNALKEAYPRLLIFLPPPFGYFRGSALIH